MNSPHYIFYHHFTMQAKYPGNKVSCHSSIVLLLCQNPGFDFSGAEISGNFAGGGPDFSSLQK